MDADTLSGEGQRSVIGTTLDHPAIELGLLPSIGDDRSIINGIIADQVFL